MTDNPREKKVLRITYGVRTQFVPEVKAHWYFNQWRALYECGRSCGAGKLWLKNWVLALVHFAELVCFDHKNRSNRADVWFNMAEEHYTRALSKFTWRSVKDRTIEAGCWCYRQATVLTMAHCATGCSHGAIGLPETAIMTIPYADFWWVLTLLSTQLPKYDQFMIRLMVWPDSLMEIMESCYWHNICQYSNRRDCYRGLNWWEHERNR